MEPRAVFAAGADCARVGLVGWLVGGGWVDWVRNAVVAVHQGFGQGGELTRAHLGVVGREALQADDACGVLWCVSVGGSTRVA